MSNPWVDPRINNLHAENVRSYLFKHGWRLRPYPRPELLVFEGPLDDNGQQIVQVVPSSEDLVDFHQGLERLLNALSVIEKRSPVNILNDMLPE